MHESRKCLLVIIGTQGELRSYSLSEFTKCFADCIYVDPVLIGASDRIEQVVNDKMCEVSVGRILSNSEIGCAIAHKKATAIAANSISNSSEVGWVLFVEDDANLNLKTFEAIKEELDGLSVNVPSLITFYSSDYCVSEKVDINKGSRKWIKLGTHWSSGTVCYAINRKGIFDVAQFSELPVDHVADWPIYYKRLKLHFSKQVKVCEVNAPSFIENRRNLSIPSRISMHSRQLFYLRKLSRMNKVSVRMVMSHLVVAPIMRDFSNLIKTLVFK
jgi:GR25 family glycosyltransferase involved in LPS biosynthesis